jgi:hypothetical protein
MRKTVKAKLLLGWMNQHDAVESLNGCSFDPPMTRKKAVALWKEYQKKVKALEPRNPQVPVALALTQAEQVAVNAHIQRIGSVASVVKVDPEQLIARQHYLVTDRAKEYAEVMKDEAARINHFLGVGLDFKGILVPKHVSPSRITVALPHFEFLPREIPGGITFEERDRYVTAAWTPLNDRMLLWCGYHRSYAILLLRQAGGEGAGAAPLLTVITGMKDVTDFFEKPRFAVRDSVLGDRPALLRDFLDPELAIEVNLRKRRAEGRIDQVKGNKCRASVFLVDDDE